MLLCQLSPHGPDNLRPPREPPPQNLEERVVVGPEERGEALLDLTRQPLVVIHPMYRPPNALVERREGFRYFFPRRAPPGSLTLAPFFRPMARTGALFARAVVCATIMSSASVLSMVLVASRRL